MNTKLFVGNLSFNTTENDLQDAFAAHVLVTDAERHDWPHYRRPSRIA